MIKQSKIVNFLQDKYFLPIELINEILELNGSLIHYKNFNKIKYDLCKKAIIKRIDKVVPWLFEDVFDETERVHFYKIFEKCECCIEHQKNRPNLNDYNNKFCPPYSTRQSRLKDCECMCRLPRK